MAEQNLILAINPGSTSTKIAVYDGEKKEFQKNLKHDVEEIKKFKCITDQYEFRRDIILKEVKEAGFNIADFKIIIGRGGLVKPIQSGVWGVNEAMLHDLRIGYAGQHASNLGGIIADDIAKQIPGVQAVIADPVVVDELEPFARVSGHPLIERKAIFHALNQKAIARQFAKDQNKPYESLNVIVVHLGGGVSVGAHKNGKIIDVNQALDGDGPFSPERSGGLPVGGLIEICFSGKYTKEQVKKMVVGEGGFVAYLGTNDALKVEQAAAAGDEKAAFYQSAMAYQVSKEVGAAAAVLKGKVDGILLTGGMAYGKDLVNDIKERVDFIAPVHVYPGEDEMGALAMNAYRVLKGETSILEYK